MKLQRDVFSITLQIQTHSGPSRDTPPPPVVIDQFFVIGLSSRSSFITYFIASRTKHRFVREVSPKSSRISAPSNGRNLQLARFIKFRTIRGIFNARQTRKPTSVRAKVSFITLHRANSREILPAQESLSSVTRFIRRRVECA